MGGSLPAWNPKIMLRSLPLLSNRFFCKCSGHHHQDLTPEMSKFKEAFAQRMAMAGLKPHHRIALGVSGGPDSMALSILTAEWKTDAQIGKDERNGFINGVLAIVVDLGLREESKDEAHYVRKSVSEMGIRCEIARCNWLNGRPKLGHLEEAARDKRYQIFQNVCIENRIGVLLVAHHADDQAELFILRLSRNSGVLGLAGMAFTSQLFPTHVHYYGESSSSHGILLVRPLLDFSKEDLYKICQRGKQKSVEDPTNQDERFARNAIRSSLRKISSCIFRSEMQAIILACRKSRSFVDKICCDLINQTVTVTSYGYAIIDLEKLNPLNIEDICLSKFIGLVLQFISQRHRPVRGRTSKLLLDYIRNYPCKVSVVPNKFRKGRNRNRSKRWCGISAETETINFATLQPYSDSIQTSLTAAACYLSAAPRSNGTKILICCSPDSPQPSKMELSHRYFCEEKKQCSISEMEQILMVGKSYSNDLVPDATDVYFLHAVSTDSLLSEAKRLKILSDSTHRSILVLQTEAFEKFNNKTEATSNKETKHEISSTSIPPSEEALKSGQCYHFINRFLVMWRLHMVTDDIHKLEEIDSNWNLDPASAYYLCNSCVVGRDAIVRYMIESDWLYLASLSKGQTSELCQEYKILSTGKNQRMDKQISCSEYIRLSAQRALQALKSIPVSARRGLPVLVNSQGLLLSIPNIYFKHCPYLSVSAVFKPRVPLGGGHSSFI